MQAKSQSTPAKAMSKMHSWPPMEQGIERPMSDMAPMFSAPALPWGPGLPKVPESVSAGEARGLSPALGLT